VRACSLVAGMSVVADGTKKFVPRQLARQMPARHE
jgi:hypothetical protein